MTIGYSRAREILAAAVGRRVIVLGDLMLDRYIWGTVGRISPEAPVPVVEVEEESSRLGGAGNVVANLRRLGAEVTPVGVVGDDASGAAVVSLLREQGVETSGIVVESGRTTSVKSRVIAHSQHVVRVDRESKSPVRKETAQKVLAFLETVMDQADVLIFQDYNKGLLTPPLIACSMELAHSKGVMTAVDPKFENFFAYTGATLFKPNRKETERVLGRLLQDRAAVAEAGRELQNRLQCRFLMITLGEDGLYLLGRDEQAEFIPTRARKVADVSGAGDTVISTAALALAAGASITEAAVLANYAAGVVCGEVGVVPIEPEALLHALRDEQ